MEDEGVRRGAQAGVESAREVPVVQSQQPRQVGHGHVIGQVCLDMMQDLLDLPG